MHVLKNKFFFRSEMAMMKTCALSPCHWMDTPALTDCLYRVPHCSRHDGTIKPNDIYHTYIYDLPLRSPVRWTNETRFSKGFSPRMTIGLYCTPLSIV